MANAVNPNEDVHHVLDQCGITSPAAHQVFILTEGLDSVEAFGDLSGDNDVTEMAKRMASRQPNNGRVILGTTHIKRLQALVYWVKDHQRRNVDLDYNDWNDVTMRASMTRKESENNFRDVDVDMIDPGKCATDHGWDAWQIGFLNKLSTTTGAARVPIDYVVRTDVPIGYAFQDEDEERKYQMPMAGENYRRDNKLVYGMLKAACVKSDAWTWIQDYDRTSDGRGAWQALINHYDGTGELNKRLERSKEEINRLHYKDEKVFPFERYVTKLKENFYILDKDDDERLTGKQKVDQMLRGIKSSDPNIVAAKTDIYKDFRSDFDGAATFLSGLIANLHAGAQLDYAHRHYTRKRNVSSIDTRGDKRFRRGGRGMIRGGRSGRGRGHQGRGRSDQRIVVNGVDISDPNRRFSSDEWNRLGAARDLVHQSRNTQGRGGGRSASGRSRAGDNTGANRTPANVAAVQAETQDGQSAITDSVVPDAASERGSQNGRRFGRGAYISRILSSARRSSYEGRRFIKANDTVPNDTIHGTESNNEIDNHADTICAGANWRVMEFTGEYCDVTPYSNEYEPKRNIPIAKCATVYTSSNGQSYLLIADQVLWFGTALPNSLINPQQIRSFGIPLCDDPWDPTRTLGMDTGNVFVPFETLGSTVLFVTHTPTDWELNNLAVIELTAPHWNPSQLDMPATLSDEEREIRSIRSLQATPTNVSTNHLVTNRPLSTVDVSESDIILSSISCTYSPKLFVQQVISRVNIATSSRLKQDATTGTGTSIAATASSERHAKLTPEGLAKKWQIGLETAKRTIEVTTQKGIRTALHPLHRRYRVDHLHLNRRRLNGEWYTDTLFSKVKSLQGNTCAQVFTNGNYTTVYPLTTKGDIGQSLTDFTDDVGIPDNLMTDGALEAVGPKTEFSQEASRLKIRLRRTEPGRSNQNFAAEREIGELKKRWRNRMLKRRVPKRLWDYGMTYESHILNFIPRGRNNRTGYEMVTGQTPDISEWLDFEFYDLVWFYDAKKMELDKDGKRLARWLGVSHRIGSDLCYWLVTENGKVIARTTVQHVTRDDYLDDKVKQQIEQFDTNLENRLDDTNFYTDQAGDAIFYLEDEEGPTLQDDITTNDEETTPEADDLTDDMIDKYIGAELIFDVGSGDERRGKVVKRSRGLDGTAIGQSHTNPLFDTREYVVEFTDGSTDLYMANIIAENMYAQVDEEGNQYQLMNEITDHRKDASAISINDGFVANSSGNAVPKKTTRGWELLVSWKDGSSDWIKLKDIKDAYPVQIAEYAVANRIIDEPAFNWWAKSVLRKRNRIISKLKSKYWKTTHKFGIEVPRSVEQALAIDEQTGTDHWRKALNKEMSRVKVSWKAHDGHTPEQVRKGEAKDLIGYQEIKCHLIFDIKMDFTRKARFVAGGHMTETPGSITYSSVVSRDSIRLAFLIAGLNDLDIIAGDVTNAYLFAPCREKIWFEGKTETGPDKGKVLILVRALYGLKSSGASWRAHLAQLLSDLGFESSKADPDVWIRSATRKDGFEYYEIILVYVDDILTVSEDPRALMKSISDVFEMKESSVKEPDIYLGADIERVQLPDGRTEWAASPRTYVKNSIKIVEDLLTDDGLGVKLKTSARNPFPSGYRPEMDVTNELNDKMASRYLQLMGILRWAIELGRIDIFTEVSQLSQHQALPREGHLEAAYHIFGYLKKHTTGARIVFDSKSPTIDEKAFNTKADWKDFYGDVKEELPPKMPKPRGNRVVISCFVDANHAGNMITRRSHSGILIYVQNAPIIWFSKRQNTVESSSFGSEFVALRIAKDLIVALRYKLRMFGVPIEGPANVFCDNNGVVKNTSLPESTLTKKHNAINYHVVREAAAAEILRVGKEDGMTNLADLFTKVLTADRRHALCKHIMY